MNKGQHKRDKSRKAIKGFDNHAGGTAGRLSAKRHGAGNGRRAASVFAARRYFIDPEAPHFRMTARTLALPGNHLRAPARPLKATHCKADN